MKTGIRHNFYGPPPIEIVSLVGRRFAMVRAVITACISRIAPLRSSLSDLRLEPSTKSIERKLLEALMGPAYSKPCSPLTIHHLALLNSANRSTALNACRTLN